MKLEWINPIHRPTDLVADVSGIGRYHIFRMPRGRSFILRLNGVEIGSFEYQYEAKEAAQLNVDEWRNKNDPKKD